MKLLADLPKQYQARNLERARTILDWISNKWYREELEISHATIKKVFGSDAKGFGRQIFDRMFKRAPGSSYNNPLFQISQGIAPTAAKCHTYLVDKDAYRQMVKEIAQFETGTDDPIEALRQKYQEELSGQKGWDYKEIDGGRRYHSMQCCERGEKPALFRGYLPYNYDISTAVATVLLQQVLALKPELAPKLEELQRYVENKELLRQEVATVAGCDIEAAKQVITAILNGSHLVPHPKNPNCRLLGEEAVIKLRDPRRCPRLREFQRACRRAWANLLPLYRLEYGLETAKNRYAIYFREERKIMDVIVQHLKARRIVNFIEHDGVRTSQPLDIALVEQEIRAATGYAVRLEAKNDTPLHNPECLPRRPL